MTHGEDERVRAGVLLLAAATLAGDSGLASQAAQRNAMQITWTFDNLSTIGGLPVSVEGHPTVIPSPVGKAIAFDGVADALFIRKHPLAGATTFTWEAIFRADCGAEEQRWFHLAQRNRETGEFVTLAPSSATQDSNPRLLFEVRI